MLAEHFYRQRTGHQANLLATNLRQEFILDVYCHEGGCIDAPEMIARGSCKSVHEVFDSSVKPFFHTAENRDDKI